MRKTTPTDPKSVGVNMCLSNARPGSAIRLTHLCYSRGGGGRRYRLGVLPAYGLGHHSIANGLGAYLNAYNLPINHRANALNIWAKLASGNARGLRADAAEVFRFTAVGLLIAEGRFLAGEIANA